MIKLDTLMGISDALVYIVCIGGLLSTRGWELAAYAIILILWTATRWLGHKYANHPPLPWDTSGWDGYNPD